MKVNFDLKSKYPSVEFCYNNKFVIIRYWGKLKFDKVVFYDSEQKNNYSEEEVILLLQKALTHQDDGEIGSLVTAQGQIRTANFFSWFETFKKEIKIMETKTEKKLDYLFWRKKNTVMLIRGGWFGNQTPCYVGDAKPKTEKEWKELYEQYLKK